ncbi:MAG TPA: SUMF1/EgtB/PvdO family nonheme iron enzyme [Steroidobacteraceae bacterium]|jgi:formylglycine-generating enzyme required for sulfatase activity|nr:SUMF1/EgtB/PvdO family nonheme iron enzyme [Steroidobacteraceae bacterium]
MFEKVLRAYETHGIPYSDVLARLRRLLDSGASAVELSAILRRRESIGRLLPEYGELQTLLNEAIEQSAAQSADADPDGAQAGMQSTASTVVAMPIQSSRAPAFEEESPDEEVAVDLDFEALNEAVSRESESPERPRASELDPSALARRLRPSEERAPARHAALESLTRSYERAKEAESAAATRAAALATDLEAARSALKAEQNRVLEIDKALASSVATSDAVREQALQESQRHRAELRAVLDSLAERDAAVDQLRHSLGERDARIKALCEERAGLATSLEARAEAAAQLEAELRAARAHAQAVSLELTASQESAKALDAQLRRGGSRLDAARKELDATREKSGTYLELLRTRAWRRGFDQNRALEVDARDVPAQGERGDPRSPRAGRAARTIGWVVVTAALIGLVWLFWHHATVVPAELPAAAVPSPGSVIRDCPTCPAMTVLPVGRFKQGSVDGPAFEQPVHWVAIDRPIAMSTNPMTLRDFEQFITATRRDMQGCDTYDGEWKHQPDNSWEQPGFSQTGMHPVTCVSWEDAEAYAKWLSTKTGHRYRLPSAAEWEYAARAGGEAAQPWGTDAQSACTHANVADASAALHYPGWAVFPCDDGYVYTAPVGAFKANAFGLNDMLGNVLQWTEDCWHPNYAGAPVDGSAWSDGDCSQHELRGGSWFSAPSYVRADYRDHFPAGYRTSSAGIRLVRDLQP